VLQNSVQCLSSGRQIKNKLLLIWACRWSCFQDPDETFFIVENGNDGRHINLVEHKVLTAVIMKSDLSKDATS
jgi:hypothetical protein